MLRLPAGVERSRLAWMCVVSLCYYAAVTIADNVAQSIFVSKLGVSALPNIFLLKAGIDVVSALCYLPLTRNRCATKVWRALLLLYASVVAAGWFAVAQEDWPSTGAYLLYAGHEVVWTLAVIHWGIFLLSVISPAQSKELFPVLFGVGRLGALCGGIIVGSLALHIGASNLLGAAIGLALLSGLASTRLHERDDPEEAEDAEDAEDERGAGSRRKVSIDTGSWAAAWASPLVKLIALSTATMVVLRYGLRMVSLDEIRTAFDNDKDQVAAFLGLFSVLGNGLAFMLGLWVVPRLLSRVGVGAANLIYASSTLLAFFSTWIAPSLASASGARFVEVPLKHALKTPLSVLFYGAENARMRVAARSLIFGAAIPIATVLAGLGFRQLREHLELISVCGLFLGLLYVALCAWQNREYRKRLAQLLDEELEGIESPPEIESKIASLAPSLSSTGRALIARAALGQSSHRSIAMVYLGEAIPHSQAQALKRALFGS